MSDPYIVTIGLETHVQLSVSRSSFRIVRRAMLLSPTHVDPVSRIGKRSSVLNRAIIERAVRVGLALDCNRGRLLI